MNKKIFTLLASLLMLFLTAFVVNAQTPVGYNPVQFLPEGVGKGAYHLQVTHFGAENLMGYSNLIVESTGSIPAANTWTFAYGQYLFLSMDERGFLSLVSADDVEDNYTDLRSALWCVDTKREGQGGKYPTFDFINKEYSTYLTVDRGSDARWIERRTGDTSWESAFDGSDIPTQSTTSGTLTTFDAHVDGYYMNWQFSLVSGVNTAIEQGRPLVLQLDDEPGYYLTFACEWPAANNPVELVKVHWDDINPMRAGGVSEFYKKHLLFFRLVSAAPRVLSAEDFNTMLGEKPLNNWTSLKFDPNTNPATVAANPFTQPLRAVDEFTPTNVYAAAANIAPGYVRLYTNTALNNNALTANTQFIYVDNTYHNTDGKRFPVIKTGTRNATNFLTGQADFRLVYYPAEDSLVINVLRFDHIVYGPHEDDLVTRITTPGDGFYNDEILDWLIVKLEDLETADGSRVLTVYDTHAHTRIHFGIGSCEVIDDRTTVPPNLYVIKDDLGRYLDMPLDVGALVPQWRYLIENEKPLKTPSSQWLVVPNNTNSEYSTVRLYNREFNWVYIDFVQVYGSPHLFKGTVNVVGPTSTTYPDMPNIPGSIFYTSEADADGFFGSFFVVEDHAQAKALRAQNIAFDKWPQEVQQKAYRTNPYLGYKYLAPDTMSYFGYAFNWLFRNNTDYYLHTPPAALNDTVLYVSKEKNYFKLELPAELQTNMGGSIEKYGLGYGSYDFYPNYESTKDIARLQRYYYYFKQNDYWNFLFDGNYISMDRAGRYVFSNEAGINVNPLKKAMFYIRFTYQPDGEDILKDDSSIPEYYTLLNRVDESDFPYLAARLDFEILQGLRLFDWSHEYWPSVSSGGFGVVTLGVQDWTLYAVAQEATGGSTALSAFAMSTVTEPLYRRFDNLHPVSGDVTGLDGETPAGEPRDYPRTLKIFRTNHPTNYLYEDAHSTNAYGKGINFLNFESINDHTQKLLNPGYNKDGTRGYHYDDPYHNFGIYLDTAYVNRGTGHIKPQYLLVVGPEINDFINCYLCGDPIEVQPWVYGRYLINATDSARRHDTNGKGLHTAGIRDENYIWDSRWERLAFVPAIHTGDTLYILRELDYETLFIQTDDFGTKYLNLKALDAEFVKNRSNDKILLNDNTHKDVVFSMRYYQRGDYENFLLESESTNRGLDPIIAPMEGGWVKEQDLELVISWGSYRNAILEAEKFNTEYANMTPEEAVGNEQISAVKVIAGQGTVTILNAAGKQVVISNVLGQTVANAVLTSDNATIDAPTGVLVIAVEGESAVKAVVK